MLAAGVSAPNAHQVHRPLTQYLVKVQGSDNGLPHNSVPALTEGPDGLPGAGIADLLVEQDDVLWIATRGELVRWDSERFSALTQRNGLADEAVCSLFEDRERNAWRGTHGGGLNRLRVPEVRMYTPHKRLLCSDAIARCPGPTATKRSARSARERPGPERRSSRLPHAR